MAPVVRGLAAQPEFFQSRVCVTAQHRQMLDQVLAHFDITPDVDLDVMRPNQDLFQITTAVLNGMKDVLDAEQPDVVLVHGDTTTTMATSLACFYRRICVGHVEAGLRTGNLHYPFPEEMNRVFTDTLASLFFAPTQRAKTALLQAGAPEARVFLTGNTVIDALMYTLDGIHRHPGGLTGLLASFGLPTPQPGRRMVLVTAHRRENFGPPMRDICHALVALLTRFPEVDVVFPVHPNPNVQAPVNDILRPWAEAAATPPGPGPAFSPGSDSSEAGRGRLFLLAPLDYVPFCALMAASHLILTDSGGVQEEAPSLSKPVLVLRDETERPEAVAAGTVRLVGPHAQRILDEATRLLTDSQAYSAMARPENPYGDGQATPRILAALKQTLLSSPSLHPATP
jgi:UDP-N-acetylglucosamine 2-epimerase